MGTVLSAMVAYYFKTLVFLPKTAAWITALFTVGSGLQYLVQGLKQLNPPEHDAADQAHRANLEHDRLR
jgi:putative Mn2+ efflux pump MntP